MKHLASNTFMKWGGQLLYLPVQAVSLFILITVHWDHCGGQLSPCLCLGQAQDCVTPEQNSLAKKLYKMKLIPMP